MSRGNAQKQRGGPERQSHASNRGEGWEPDGQRAAGGGTIGESPEGGMADRLLPTSPSALSVRPDLAQERGGRKEALNKRWIGQRGTNGARRARINQCKLL